MKNVLSNEAIAVQSLFWILNKDRQKVRFVLNDPQVLLDRMDNANGRVRLIIAKARQKGFSRGILAKFAVRCLGIDGTRAVVISHEKKATKRLFAQVSYYYKHMNGPKPILDRASAEEMSFPETDSSYYLGTAGSRAFGRGDTITDLHCSEFAWWETPESIVDGLFDAVPMSGRIYIESTGNGRNNDFFYRWENAESMGFTRLFYPWFGDLEYSLPVTSWQPDCPRHNGFLLDMQKKFNLSGQQMAFYEAKLKEKREDLKLMQQEYPSEPDECFQATGGSVFENVNWTYSPDWESINYEGYYVYRLRGHPVEGHHYVIGGDPSGGTGHDDAGLNVFCVETGEQVFELFYNTINPIRFGELLCGVGKEYNEAFIVCESNNHGAAVIPYLKDNYPPDKLYKRKFATHTTPAVYGWNNSENTKHALVGTMLEYLDQITLYGTQTVKELKAFEENKDGRFGGKSDNLVIATGLAMLGLRKFEYLREEFNRPRVVITRSKPNYMTVTFEELLKNIEERRLSIGRYGGQAGSGYDN